MRRFVACLCPPPPSKEMVRHQSPQTFWNEYEERSLNEHHERLLWGRVEVPETGFARVLPSKIVSLLGQRGAGKSSVLHGCVDDEWVEHPARFLLLRPSMRSTVIFLAAKIVAKALAAGIIRVNEWPEVVQNAIHEIQRPVYPTLIHPESALILHEFGVFQKCLPDDNSLLLQAEGFLNARRILVEEFPASLFSDPSYIPTSRETFLCRAPSLCNFEGYSLALEAKIVESAGAFQQNRFDLATVAPSITLPVCVVGLHALEPRLEMEAALFKAFVDAAAQRKIDTVGLLFTQVDEFKRKGRRTMEIRDTVDQLLSAMTIERPGKQAFPSVLVSVCCAIDRASSSVAIGSMARENGIFKIKRGSEEYFYECGIASHVDVDLTVKYRRSISWSRSVFGLDDRMTVKDVKWSSNKYALLDPTQRETVRTLLMSARRKESAVCGLPSSVLFHVLTFVVSLEPPSYSLAQNRKANVFQKSAVAPPKLHQ